MFTQMRVCTKLEYCQTVRHPTILALQDMHYDCVCCGWKHLTHYDVKVMQWHNGSPDYWLKRQFGKS